MRIVGALVMASAPAVLLLAALGIITTGAAVAIAVICMVLGVIIVAAASL